MGDVLSIEQRRRSLVPQRQARLDRSARLRSGQRFGEIDGLTLSTILTQLDRGEVRQWADLVRFILDTDADMASLYDARVSRVTQADWTIKPNPFGDPKLAKQAAEFINNMIMPRISGWAQSFRQLAGAVATGFACAELAWAYDPDARYHYVDHLDHVIPNQFRWGPHWDLRYFNEGRARGADGYGEILQPNGWVVHTHPTQDGTPATYGVMKASVWPWLFTRFGEKAFTLGVDKFGHPILYALVNPDTPQATRQALQDGLDSFSYDHTAVLEKGNELQALDIKGKDSAEVYDKFLAYEERKLTRLWLGASDATGPGENGSQAAVTGRIGAFTDPKMVTDGDLLTADLERDIFASCIRLNMHVFGLRPEQAALIPTPIMRLKTADDEAQRDNADARAEGEGTQDERTQAQVPEQLERPGLSADQMRESADMAARVSRRELPRDSAVMLLRAVGIPQEQAEVIIPSDVPKPRLKASKPSALQDRDERIEDLMPDLLTFERVVVCGGPGAGKSTLAQEIAERAGGKLRRTDDLLDTIPAGRERWSQVSQEVADWIGQPGSWVIEGVACARALRKWMAQYPRRSLRGTAVLYLRDARTRRTDGQTRLALGDETVWREIRAELARRGAWVVEL